MEHFQYSKHPFHIVSPSPWPILTSFSIFTMLFGSVLFFHCFDKGNVVLFFGLSCICFTLINWWRDVIREATFEGHHNILVQKGLKVGMMLFIISEVMFFFGFFWSFFHSALVPTIELGIVWPPKGLETFSAIEIPLLNTVILLLSGASITWAHHSILLKLKSQAVLSLVLTIILAGLFTFLQIYEYCHAAFTIADSVYGSCFYLSTAWHSFHILIGTFFLIVCLFRLIKDHFSIEHHLCFTFAIWYYHFVDVIWICLFVLIYCWGN